MSFSKNILTRLVPTPVLAHIRLINDKSSYLYSTGWMKSLKSRKPLDMNGKPIPWMNFPTIRFLEERLTHDLTLFEFGSGYSTIFYATRVRSVDSIEYDEKWFQSVKAMIPANVTLIYSKRDVDGEYCRTIGLANRKYDVVIVDGRDRVNCIRQSIPALTSRGVILLDDSQRDRYKEGIDYAAASGFKSLHLEGLKPTGSGADRTTIFYRDGNSLGI